MAKLTIFHNPGCSKSRAALALATESGVELEERRYLEEGQAPDQAELLELLAILEDPPRALVRRDGEFAELGLSEIELDDPSRVAEILAAHPALLERPILVRDGRAIIGRPTERVIPFLNA
jgi:arsenate reductase